MIPNSAWITVGESQETLAKVDVGLVPATEYAAMRNHHFTKIVNMTDLGYDPSSLTAGARFAALAYRITWECDRVLLGEEFRGTQYLPSLSMCSALCAL